MKRTEFFIRFGCFCELIGKNTSEHAWKRAMDDLEDLTGGSRASAVLRALLMLF
ncbi:hypothetical protein [Arundinibacter roseus]|uniref:hypothetical protein n=1 Tax=Arundinibacter roseus TaxID=2070510 RepID=UPI0014052D4E|nr:hypothetical protein [Arundinibacter roseus]